MISGSRPALAAIEREMLATAVVLEAQTSRLPALNLLNRANIGRLNGDERVASYIFELGVRTGGLASGDAAIDIPLAREDIADHLALNAGTLSRIMTRLRAHGAVGRSSRGKLAIRSWAKLGEMIPIADVIAPQLADWPRRRSLAAPSNLARARRFIHGPKPQTVEHGTVGVFAGISGRQQRVAHEDRIGAGKEA